VHELARRYNLRVIEDAAHALPAACGGRRVGAISELTAFSFYATKTITTGEGGMLTTNEDGYAERAAMMRLHGIGKNDAWKRYSRTGSWEYEVLRAGYKFNLPDVLAAIGLAQLRKCDQLWQQRCELAQAYRSRLSQVEEIELPPLGPEGSSHSWHLFIIRLKNGALDLGRNEFIEKLKEAGIGTSVHFIPLHRHPYYREHCHCQPADFPHAEDAFSRCLSLPIYPGLSDQQVAAVVNTISRIVVEHRRRSIFASA
jgi:perosamine synthetase